MERCRTISDFGPKDFGDVRFGIYNKIVVLALLNSMIKLLMFMTLFKACHKGIVHLFFIFNQL